MSYKDRPKNQGDPWNRSVAKPVCTRRLVFETNDTTVDFLKKGESYWLLDSPRQMLLWPVKVEKIKGEEDG